MPDGWSLFWFIGTCVSAFMLTLNLGWLIWIRRGQRFIEGQQADLDFRLRLMQDMTEKVPLLQTMVSVSSWRDLPPDARIQIRRAMEDVLAEMAADEVPPEKRH